MEDKGFVGPYPPAISISMITHGKPSHYFKNKCRCPECTKAATDWTKQRMERLYEERLAKAKDAPCLDCGGRFPPECMDFDHIPERGKKVTSVARAARRFSQKRFEEELAKCELVCANCHRIRTRERGSDRGGFSGWRKDED